MGFVPIRPIDVLARLAFPVRYCGGMDDHCSKRAHLWLKSVVVFLGWKILRSLQDLIVDVFEVLSA